MKTIVIPLLKTVNSIGVAGPIEILTKTCPLWEQLSEGKSQAPLFDVQVVSENGKPVSYANGITIRPNANIGNVKPDLIVVPSIDEELHDLQRNRLLLAWIKESFKRGAHVSSLCTGAFVLGASGVLDRRRATTHWLYAEEFRRRFPQVELQESHMVVDDGDIVTCGGATTFLNLMIYLIGKYFSHDLAVRASKVFLIDMDRPSQLPYKVHTFSVAHGDKTISRIQGFMAEHFKEELFIADIARRAGMSVRNFSRRFRQATGEAFSSYLQKLRIENAKRLLETTDFSASEVMYKVGYSDERSFRRSFKQHTGLAPKHYRNKFKLRFENVT